MSEARDRVMRAFEEAENALVEYGKELGFPTPLFSMKSQFEAMLALLESNAPKPPVIE